MPTDVLAVANLMVRRADRLVLDDVSLAVRPAAITSLLGANGAGKSSLVMTIAGVLPAASGTISVDGASLRNQSPDAVRRRGVAVVPEGHRTLTALSVADNLRAAGSELSRGDLDRQVETTLRLFPELVERLEIKANNLSGGQKQMVAIAQALISKPRFLLIDELSFGLAPAVVNRLGSTLVEIAKTGTGILLIEQFTTLAQALAEFAYVMEGGRIVFSGTSKELQARPEVLHKAYLASASA